MDTSCPYCSKRIFQVTVSRTYQVHRELDPVEERCVRERVEEARCSSCGRVLPEDLWEGLRPASAYPGPPSTSSASRVSV